MSIGEICNRKTVIAEKTAEIREAARLMREHHVGAVVVVDRSQENMPIGIVTDRDLVVEVLARDVSTDAVTVGDVMSLKLGTAHEQDDFWETLNRMRTLGVRRMPVVNDNGHLVGILTADDILELIAGGVTGLLGLVKRELDKETHRRP